MKHPIRPGAATVFSLGLVACGAPVQPTVTEVAAVPSVIPVAPPPAPRTYVIDPALMATSFSLPEGHRGFLAPENRTELDATGGVVSSVRGPLTITRAFAVPPFLGGGFVFEARSLYFSSTFLGRPEPLGLVPTSMQQISFGPRTTLVTNFDGLRSAFTFPDAKIQPVEPVGAVNFHTIAGGISLAEVEGGFLLSTRDGGKTWSNVTSEIPGTVKSIANDDAGIYVTMVNDLVMRLDKDGLTRSLPMDKPKDGVVRGAKGAALIESAVRAGVPTDDSEHPSRSLIVDGGAVLEIDLITGQIAREQRGLLPPDMPCTPTKFSSEIVVVCVSGDKAVVASGQAGHDFVVERTFNSRGVFVRGSGDALLFNGPCELNGKKGAAVACVRRPKNRAGERWTEIDWSAQLSSTDPKKSTKVVRWVVRGFNDLALVLGGNDGGIARDATSERSHVRPEAGRALESQLPMRSSILEDHFTLDDDGTIVGGQDRTPGIRVVDAGDKIITSAFSFPTLRRAGKHSLAIHSSGSIWQSSDWGQTYLEVQAPPSGRPKDIPNCSEAGCLLTPWLRFGWPDDVPTEHLDGPPTLPSGTSAPPSVPRTIACTAEKSIAPKSVETSITTQMGLGAEPVSAINPDMPQWVRYGRTAGSPTSAYAFEFSKAPTYKDDGTPQIVGNTNDLHFVFVDPFDPGGTKKHATLAAHDLLSAATSLGGPSPFLFGGADYGQGIPILSADPTRRGSGVFGKGPTPAGVWLQDAKATLVPLQTYGSSVLSVIETRPGELTYLWSEDRDREHVSVFRSNKPDSKLFDVSGFFREEFVGTDDSLAVAKDGTLAVIRVASNAAPTAESPAFLLKPGELPVALAPWTKLALASDPACQNTDGFRTVVRTHLPWLAVSATSDDVPTTGEVLMAEVRWSPEHLCLEAAEIPDVGLDTPRGNLDRYVAIRFDGKGGRNLGAHVSFGEGIEQVEPVSCGPLSPLPH